MKLYRIDFTTYQEIEEEEAPISSTYIEDMKKKYGEDNISFDEEGNIYLTTKSVLFVGGVNFPKASMSASRELEKIYGHAFELNSVIEQPGVNIINWGEEDKCDCPYCKVVDASPEELMTFTCTCGNEITVVNDGWEAIRCRECDQLIMRDRVIDLPENKFTYISIAGDNQEEEDENEDENFDEGNEVS